MPLLKVDSAANPDDPSTIGIDELVADNLLIVRLYRGLAARHDALVDEVMKFLKSQAQ